MDISFEIYNEDAVKRLQEEDPDILPEYSIDEEKDLVYNKKQVNAAITSAILQGKSIPNIASDLSSRMKTTNQQTAVKAARTAVTSAQNGGRLESFYKAKEMGIDVKKKWMATLDSRTRPRHRDLDGEIREVEEAFSNGLMYPGDSSGAAGEVWWCRCRLGKYLPDVDMSDAVRWSRDSETGERSYVPNVTYKEWLEGKNVVATKTNQTKIKGEYEDDIEGYVEYEADKETGKLKISLDDGNVTLEYDLEKHIMKYKEGDFEEESELNLDEYDKWLSSFGLKDNFYAAVEKLKQLQTFNHTQGITANTKKGMRNALNSSPYDFVRKIYEKYQNDIKCVNGRSSKGFFRRSEGGIYVNEALAVKGSEIQAPYETLFHEFGHNIDWLLGGKNAAAYASNLTYTGTGASGTIYSSTKLKDVIISDYAIFKKSIGVSDDSQVIAKLKAEKMTKRATGSVSDVLEGCTGIAMPLGVGHKAGYYANTGKSEREFFAETLASAAANEESYKQLSRIFPNAVTMVQDICNGGLSSK